MIIYNVTVKVDEDIHKEWLDWMKGKHVPDVMKTGFFVEHKIGKLLLDDEDGITYSIQYTCNSMEDYKAYEKNYAPALKAEHAEKFKDKFVAFRTLLEVID